jgi:hypothetical protein
MNLITGVPKEVRVDCVKAWQVGCGIRRSGCDDAQPGTGGKRSPDSKANYRREFFDSIGQSRRYVCAGSV